MSFENEDGLLKESEFVIDNNSNAGFKVALANCINKLFYRRKFRQLRQFTTSLLFLRVLNALLVIILLLDIGRILTILDEWQQYFAKTNNQEQLSFKFNWKNVDLEEPSSLDSAFYEALRLNELLVTPTSWLTNDRNRRCVKRVSVGNASGNFFVCVDTRYLRGGEMSQNRSEIAGNALSITGRRRLIGEFEQQLFIDGRWTLFLPKTEASEAIVDRFNGDLELHYMFDNRNDNVFPVYEIAQAIENERYAISKLDLYGESNDPTYHPYRQLENLITRLNTRQLMFTMLIDDASTILAWYRTLHRLFYHHSYALLGAQSNGACDASRFLNNEKSKNRRQICEYRVTFLKIENSVEQFACDEDVPTFGFVLGSPLEEKHRLLQEILNVIGDSQQCYEFPLENVSKWPLPCQYQVNNLIAFDFNKFTNRKMEKCSSLIYALQRPIFGGQSELNEIASIYGQICTRVNILHPFRLDATVRIPTTLNWTSIGISPNNKSERFAYKLDGKYHWQIFWPFHRLMHVVDVRAYESNILVLELYGNEWSAVGDNHESSLLGGILNSGSECSSETLRYFEQIILKIRVWAIEEAPNYRRMYRHLLRLKVCNDFKKVFARHVDFTTFIIAFKRLQVIDTY